MQCGWFDDGGAMKEGKRRALRRGEWPWQKRNEDLSPITTRNWIFPTMYRNLEKDSSPEPPDKSPMAPHSSTVAWKIPWTEEPGGLQSMGSLRVGHDWTTSLSLFTFMHWRRTWQPTPVFLPGESQGWGILVGCRLWGRTKSDTTEAT